MLLHYFFMKKMTKERIFNIGGMSAICLVVFASSLVFTFLYDYDCVRWCVAALVSLLVLFKRSAFMNMVKGLKDR